MGHFNNESINNQDIEASRWWAKCQRGSVTKKAGLDLYNMVKGSGIFNNAKMTWHVMNILLNNNTDIGRIDELPKIAKQQSHKRATDRQVKALNRTIFGKHYSVEVYSELMETLFNLKAMTQCQESREEQEFVDDSPEEVDDAINFINNPDSQPQSESESEEQQFIKALRILTSVAHDIKSDQTENKESRRQAFWDTLDSICRIAQ